MIKLKRLIYNINAFIRIIECKKKKTEEKQFHSISIFLFAYLYGET